MISRRPIPRLLASIPATGGTLKAEPGDFLVEEVPAYAPCGSGDHLFLWVEKIDLTGEQMISRLARAFGVRPSEVGTAGTKDRHAVTRQWVSVPRAGSPLPDAGEGIRILDAAAHTNRLKTGHLRANRFVVRIRDVKPDPAGAAACAKQCLERLSAEGIPNFFGPQRFGRDGETAAWGMSLIAGKGVPGHVTRSRHLLRLSLSAAQSLLYNEVLVRRMADGLYRRVIPGDVLKKVDSGGLFNADPASLDVDQARLQAGEIVHAGPMFGRRTFPALDEAARRESAVLDDAEITPDLLGRHGRLLEGTRRPDIVYPSGTSVEQVPEGIVVAFTLPAGSYATVLLAEIMG